MDRLRMNALLISMGLVTMVAQIVIMRRLIVVFGGNELVAGAVLAGWLVWSGIGNVVAGHFADTIKNVGRWTAVSLIAMAVAIPLTTAAAILVKVALGIPASVMTGFPIVIAATGVLMAPLGLSIGIAFTIACKVPAQGLASDIGLVWGLDAIGAGIGGLVFSLIVIEFFTPIQAACITAAVLVAAVAIAFRRLGISIASLVTVTILALVLWFGHTIDSGLARVQWRGFSPVVQKESLFANLMVTDNRGERTMFVNGRPAFSLPLPETYETIAHLPLIEHPDPREVAIVGGGMSGMVDQWRQWNLSGAHFMKPDKDEVMLERYAMPSDINPLPPWVFIHNQDGRRLFKEGLGPCKEACLDVIIINVGDPDTAAADRYFTAEFFREARKMLKVNGVLAVALLEPANVIGKEQERILGTIRASIGEVFPAVVLLPLERFYFVASIDGSYITDNLQELDGHITNRGIKAEYLRSRTLAGIFQERVQSFKEQIEGTAKRSPINTDLKPIAYHAGMMLWEARAGRSGGGFTAIASKARWWMFLLLLVAASALSITFGRRAAERVRASWVLSSLGFASIVYEIALIVHYQMSEGLLIWRIGLIMTSFMVGAGLGVFTAIKLLAGRRPRPRTIALALLLLALYMPLESMIVRASFLLAIFVMGFIGGWVYQLMVSRMAGGGMGIGRVAGIIESADHWGAAAGAILASVVLIPLVGLPATLYIAAAVLATAAIVTVAI